jgi:hypothetical protein
MCVTVMHEYGFRFCFCACQDEKIDGLVKVGVLIVISPKFKSLNCTLKLMIKPESNQNFQISFEIKSNSSPNLILNFSSKSVAI